MGKKKILARGIFGLNLQEMRFFIVKKDTQSTWGQTFKSSVKIIACVISLLMIFHTVPANVYAKIVDSLDTSTTDTANDETTGGTEGQIYKTIFEVVELREETVKHFRTEDGTYVAAQYDYPVHKLDANGEWQDIDNTLAESGSEYATPNAYCDNNPVMRVQLLVFSPIIPPKTKLQMRIIVNLGRICVV